MWRRRVWVVEMERAETTTGRKNGRGRMRTAGKGVGGTAREREGARAGGRHGGGGMGMADRFSHERTHLQKHRALGQQRAQEHADPACGPEQGGLAHRHRGDELQGDDGGNLGVGLATWTKEGVRRRHTEAGGEKVSHEKLAHISL
jgi:hypothetical protein